MKKFFFIFLLSLVLVSCGGNTTDEPAPVVPENPDSPQNPGSPDQQAMVFMPYSSPDSRASETPMENVHTLFEVWTFKNTPSSTTENVMPGYTVKYLDGTRRWQYDGTTYSSDPDISGQYLKYWDASALTYDFMAYAPVALPDGVNVVADGSNFSITGLTAHTQSTPDILIAHQRRYINPVSTLKDEDVLAGEDNVIQPTVFYDPVPLRFHHMFSKVEYRIYNTGSETAVISHILVNYNTGETLSTGGSFTNGVWTDITSTSNSLMSMEYVAPHLLELEPIKPEEYKSKSEPLITYNEIPQNLKRYINISVEIEGQVVSKKFDLPDAAWKYDTDYIYYIRIEAGDSQGDPILIDLTVEDFLRGDPVDDIQTNW